LVKTTLYAAPGLADPTGQEMFYLYPTAPDESPDRPRHVSPLTWIPVYIFVLYWILKNDRKAAFRFVLLSLIIVGITDLTAASFIKPWVGRWRPCYDPDTMGYLRDLIGCGGLFSFPSNHATNHFCLAVFWFGAVNHIKGHRWYWLFVWAALVCYGQVYVGKHFPLDVFAGAIYGSMIGAAGLWVFQNIHRFKFSLPRSRIEEGQIQGGYVKVASPVD
jgi:membrane-associated phospholipid phosphatase